MKGYIVKYELENKSSESEADLIFEVYVIAKHSEDAMKFAKEYLQRNEKLARNRNIVFKGIKKISEGALEHFTHVIYK